MVIPLSLAMVLQAASANTVPLTCSLVTPATEAIDVTVNDVTGSAGRSVMVVPQSDSVWPRAPLQLTRSGRSSSWMVSDGRNGLVLEVGRPDGSGGAMAVLSRQIGRRAAYPVAVGTCRAASGTATVDPAPAAPYHHDSDIAAFDPERWPDDCGMLLDDGRRVSFDYTIAGPGGPVRIESGALWGNRPVTVRWANVRFGGRSGPAGSERMLGHGDVRVKIIHFSRIGDPAVSAQTGIGICGYTTVVRRPSIR